MNAKCWMSIAIACAGAPLWTMAAQPRTVEIAVTANGFEPSHVKVVQGQPLKLVVTRKTDDTCAKEIVIPDADIKAELPLGKPVALQFTPKRAGELKYSCGMNMVSGVIEVASSDGSSNPQPGACGMGAMSGAGDMHRMHPMGSEPRQEEGTHGESCGCMRGGTASDRS